MLIMPVEPNSRGPKQPRYAATNDVRNDDQNDKDGDYIGSVFRFRRRQWSFALCDLKRPQRDCGEQHGEDNKSETDE
jgi:hypothetical protein